MRKFEVARQLGDAYKPLVCLSVCVFGFVYLSLTYVWMKCTARLFGSSVCGSWGRVDHWHCGIAVCCSLYLTRTHTGALTTSCVVLAWQRRGAINTKIYEHKHTYTVSWYWRDSHMGSGRNLAPCAQIPFRWQGPFVCVLNVFVLFVRWCWHVLWIGSVSYEIVWLCWSTDQNRKTNHTLARCVCHSITTTNKQQNNTQTSKQNEQNNQTEHQITSCLGKAWLRWLWPVSRAWSNWIKRVCFVFIVCFWFVCSFVLRLLFVCSLRRFVF